MSWRVWEKFHTCTPHGKTYLILLKGKTEQTLVVPRGLVAAVDYVQHRLLINNHALTCIIRDQHVNIEKEFDYYDY